MFNRKQFLRSEAQKRARNAALDKTNAQAARDEKKAKDQIHDDYVRQLSERNE